MTLKSKPRRPFITLREATFRLGDRLVFENTQWMFHRGEQWAVIGPNGSGKSLLADALRGRLPLVQGELHHHFSAPAGLGPEELIGHVSFEERKQEVHDLVVQSRWNSFEADGALRVKKFLSYEAVMEVNPFDVSRSHSQARRQFEMRRRRAVAQLRIAPFLDRTLLSLSNGETQRVRLARALCHPLRLLILDEPFAGLDAASRKDFGRLLEGFLRSSLRVLLITTRLEDLPRHITHVLRLENCRVAAAGPRSRLVVTPEVRQARRAAKSKTSTPAAPRVHVETARYIQRLSDQPRPRNALVRLENVTVEYGAAVILRDVSWTVREGESWALLGPNGSGKSTLLSLVLGDNPQAYRNHVEVFGKRRGTGESIWDLKQQIGWVSPELHLHFQGETTCVDTVVSGFHETIGLFQAVTTHQAKAAREQLRKFELVEFSSSPLNSLSTGLQRMVLLARALVKQPRLLVLDEPCQGLDTTHRSVFLTTVESLIRTGAVTVIYVTHRPDEIPPSVKNVLRLRNGRQSGRKVEGSRPAGLRIKTWRT